MIFRRKNPATQATTLGPTPPATPPIAEQLRSKAPRLGYSRKKILLVDDDLVLLKALSSKLQSFGFTVVTAAEGSQALNVTRREKPDVMLLDVHFPPDVAHGGGVPWNGFLITQWLRRLEDARNTPVILISANDRAEYKQKASDVGAAAFLPKPIDSNLLLASINTALHQVNSPRLGRRVEPGDSEKESQDSNTTPRRCFADSSSDTQRDNGAMAEFGL
jgi:CheY-like chemotaxis protein